MSQSNAKGINVPVGGDLSGSLPNPTVVAIQSFPVSATAPTANQVLEWNGSSYVPTTITATLAGDVTGPIGSNTVINIHGASVPIAGSLTTGNVLQVSGSSTLSYGAVNLAGGSNFVTNNLPISNVAPGTSAQILMSNGTPATTWTTMSGDVTIGATGSTTVGKIQNNTVTSGALTKGQFFVASSTSNWAATTLSGDILESSSTAGLLTVTGVQGNTFTAGAPTKGQFVVATSTTNYGPVTISGDISESGSTAGLLTVIALQNNAVQSGVLGSAQDGYVLSWVDGSSQFQVKQLLGDVINAPSSNAVISITGTGTNSYTSSGTNVNVAATETVIASGSTAPVKSSAGTVNTTDGTTWVTISSWIPGTSTVEDLFVTLAARSATNDGYYYRGDIFFTVSRTGSSAPVFNPSVPSVSNVRSNGNVLAVRINLSTNTVQIQVQGFASNTYHWSCLEQHAIVT